MKDEQLAGLERLANYQARTGRLVSLKTDVVVQFVEDYRAMRQRAEAAEAALLTAMAEAQDYRLKLLDVVNGTAIGQLETDLAYYKAMVAAVPEYIKDHVEDVEVSPSLEEWFEGTITEYDE